MATFHNLNLRFATPEAFAAWLRTQPRPTWPRTGTRANPIGVTYHNTFKPDESQWRGHASMRSVQTHYESLGWDRGPHVFIASGTAHDGIYVMTPPHLPGIHAGDCNSSRFGIEVVGDFQARPMSEAQLTLLVEVAAVLHRYAEITTPDIVSHRDCIPGRTCPGDAAQKQKSTIQQRLALALATRPPVAHGFVLTNIRSLATLRNYLDTGRYTTLKIVTAWGLPTSWTPSDRAMVARMPQTLIVRTHAGDPSSGKPFLHHEEVRNEIAPWYAVRPDIWIELDNEPNSADLDLWGYRYHLGLAIDACRTQFPRAKIIAPALLLDRGEPDRWLTILGDLYRQCDAIGVHVYAFHSLVADDTGQQALARKLYSRFDLPLALTEYGINDGRMSKAEKGAAYARFVQNLPSPYQLATSYHVDQAATPGTNDAFYHLTLDSHRAYAAAMKPQGVH